MQRKEEDSDNQFRKNKLGKYRGILPNRTFEEISNAKSKTTVY